MMRMPSYKYEDQYQSMTDYINNTSYNKGDQKYLDALKELYMHEYNKDNLDMDFSEGYYDKKNKKETVMGQLGKNFELGDNCFFIQPVNNGFLVFTNLEDRGVEIHAKETWKSVNDFLTENAILDLNSDEVADSL